MQKVLQRTKRAETRFSKERQRFDSLRENQKRTANRREQQEITRYRNETYKTARNQRKEDWALGPLAPKRKVGPGADEYGAMSKEQFRGAALWEDKRIKYWPIIEDDRVVIVEPGHQDRGKIGKVISIDKDQNTLKVEALNMIDVTIPDHIAQFQGNGEVVRTMEGGLPLSSVRLVYPLTDRNTNETRDVVISAIRLGKRYTIKDDDEGRRVRYNRYIEGAKPPVLIEWPPKKKLDHPEYEDDTKRLLVEKVTFVPTLLKEPFPGAIIDELRHKYSKFRDRHDDDFIARKLALDEEEGKLEKQSRTLRGISVRETLQSSDARILRRARREAEGKIGAAKRIPGMKKPDAEMIAAFVGQHVLREKALAAQGLDRSPVGPSQSSLLNSEASLTTPSTETSAAIQQLSAASLSTPVPLASIF